VDVDIVAFDVFGTLVDWRTSIAAALARSGEAAGITADWPAVADSWRARYHPALARVTGGERPFLPLDDLHAETLDEVIAEHGLHVLGADARRELVRAWHHLAPWPDAVPGLAALRERHLLSTLSNGGIGLLTRLVKAAALPMDCILSAELAGTYKPDPRVYALVPGYFGVAPDRVLMVACHPEDLQAAGRCGLRTGYVARPREWGPHGSAAPPPPGTDVAAGDLIELAGRIS
jgi:2-haloacid dehalogenase